MERSTKPPCPHVGRHLDSFDRDGFFFWPFLDTRLKHTHSALPPPNPLPCQASSAPAHVRRALPVTRAWSWKKLEVNAGVCHPVG